MAGLPDSQAWSSSPSATITAGPVRKLVRPSNVTRRRPPGMSTTQPPDSGGTAPAGAPPAVRPDAPSAWSADKPSSAGGAGALCPPLAATVAAIAAATAPVPQDLVAPLPRSYTRIRMCPLPTTLTSSRLTPSGNVPHRARAAATGRTRPAASPPGRPGAGCPATPEPFERLAAERRASGPEHRGMPMSTVMLAVRLRPDQPGPAAGRDGELGPAHQVVVEQVPGEHPDAVAAHLGQAAVGVAVVHEPLRTVAASRRRVGRVTAHPDGRSTPSAPSPARRSQSRAARPGVSSSWHRPGREG